mgnify:FL=1
MPRRFLNKDTPCFRPAECKFCGKILSRKATLLEHIADVHKTTKKITCTVENCDYKTNRIGNYNIHLQKTHKIELPITSCYTIGCGKKSRCEYSLIMHMKKCKGNPKFDIIKCPVKECKEEFLSIRGLQSHLRIRHGDFKHSPDRVPDRVPDSKYNDFLYKEVDELLIL